MIRKISLVIVVLTGIYTPCDGQEWARKMFKTTEHDFGTVARGAKAEFDFAFANRYVEDVHVMSVRSSCGCTSVEIVNSSPLKSYEEGAIHARFNTPTFLGSRSATITVIFDKPFYAEVLLHVRGVIRSDLTFDPGSVQFGDVEQGIATQRQVRVNFSGWSRWNVTDVKSSNPHISAKVVETKRYNGLTTCDLAVQLDKDAPAGYLQDHLMLVTSEGQNFQMPLAVEGRIVSPVTVSPSSLLLGVVHPGQEVTKPLVVKGTKPFRIVSIHCDDKGFRFGKLSEEAKAIHVVPVTFAAGTDLGQVTKTIRVQTDLGKAAAELSAQAVVASQTASNDK